MVQRGPVILALPDARRAELIRPGADSRYRIAGRRRPRPVPQDLKARNRVRVAVTATTPPAGEHAPDYLGIQVGAAGGQWLVAADDAVEGQDQRHGGGLLQGRAVPELS